jgi:hypothetical protein
MIGKIISTVMHLDRYPAAIAKQLELCNTVEAQIASYKLQQLDLENSADEAIAFDPELKNELQRKVRKGQLLGQTPHPTFAEAIANLIQDKSSAIAKLEQLRGEFSVKRLEMKLKIAQTMGQDAADFSL